MFKKIIKNYSICSLLLVLALMGCTTTGSNTFSNSSSGFTNQKNERPVPPINMEIIIPVFDGGIEKDETGKVVDEVKRAEALYFATKVKRHIEDRKFFFNPKVMPSARAAGDIYLHGNIITSNGLELKVKITAEDSSGKRLYTKTYSHKCDQKCASRVTGNPRFGSKDRFEYVVYRKIAIDLEKYISKKRRSDLQKIRNTTEIKFARDMAPDKFNQYIKTSKSKNSISGMRHKLVSAPDDLDPMYLRIKAVRAKEQMFVDDTQPYIDDFVDNSQFLSTYSKWQDKSSRAILAQQKAQSAQTRANIGAIIGIAAAIYGASEGNSDVAIGGAVVADQSFKAAKRFSEEAEMWKDELNEMNIDINKELAPRNIEIENTVFELRGSIAEQFDAYREFLRSIYIEETTPLDNSYQYSIN